MKPFDPTRLSDDELVSLLKNLQHRFDRADASADLMAIHELFHLAYQELRRRGWTELKIAWALHETPSA